MKTKKAVAKKSNGANGSKKAKAKKQRTPIPYASLAKMWEQGKTYQEMGQTLGIRGQEEKDPFKPVRAAISNMLNGKASAWKDKTGKICILKPRDGMRNIGKGKKKLHTKKVSKKVVKVTKADGKTLAAAGGK